MLLLISGDIHPNPGPIEPRSVCSLSVTGRNRLIQCANCSLWVHLSRSDIFPADFKKIYPGHSWTCPMCPSSSQTSSSCSQTVSQFSFLNTSKTQKSSLSRIHPQNISLLLITPDLPNHPQLTFTYTSSVLFSPSQPQPFTSPLTQSSFHPFFSSQNSLQILQYGMPMEFGPCRTKLIQFLSLNQYNLIFVQESHLSSDSTFYIPRYQTLKKDRAL